MKRLVAVLFLLAAGAAGYAFWMLHQPYQGFSGEIFVDIPHGASTRAIADLLAEKGVVKSPWTALAARAVEQRPLLAGEYRFEGPSSPLEVLGRIERGDTFYLKLVVPEGYNLFDIADAVGKLGVFSREKFLGAARDAAMIRDLDPKAPTLEGYLFPDTYRVNRKTTPKVLCRTMTDRFRGVWAQLNGKDAHRTVTLASLVEREARLPAERPHIAGVFANRLRTGMPLGCDPTVVYAALLDGRFRGTIYKSDLQRESPWNTYTTAGLPPGPIANPGLSSLQAALAPETTADLYFVAKGDGSGAHTFSDTLEKHAAATQVLRRAEKQQSRK